jgi:DNA polymerase I-like protein with 3'-5' exonuclease and polymerase domains
MPEKISLTQMYNMIENNVKASKFIQRAVAIDFETVSDVPQGAIDARVAKPQLLSVCTKIKNMYKTEVYDWNEEVSEFLYKLSQLEIPLVIQNAYFDILLASWRGAFPKDLSLCKCTILDLLLNLYFLKDSPYESIGLKEAALKYLNVKMSTYADHLKEEAEITQLTKDHEEAVEKLKNRINTLENRYKEGRIKLQELMLLNKDHTKAYQSKYQTVENYKNEMKEIEQNISKEQEIYTARFKAKVDMAQRNFYKYAKEDSYYTLKLFFLTLEKIKEERLLKWCAVENVVRTATLQMSLEGVYLDINNLKNIQQDIDVYIQQCYNKLLNDIAVVNQTFPTEKQFDMVSFNPSSGDDIAYLLWDRLDLTPPNGFKLTKKLQLPDVAKTTLEKVEHPIAQEILNYRTALKLKKSYATIINAAKYNPIDTERINFQFVNTHKTITGRFSSQGFPLSKIQGQNIDGKSKSKNYAEEIRDIGKFLRGAFSAPPGYKILVLDLSQIELRMTAHYTQDPALLAVYKDYAMYNNLKYYTGDIHAATMERLGVNRGLAKASNFGRLYGVGDYTFGKNAGLLIKTEEEIVKFNAKVKEAIKKTYKVQDEERINLIATNKEIRREAYSELHKRDLYFGEEPKYAYVKSVKEFAVDIFYSEELGKQFMDTYKGIFAYHDKLNREKHDKLYEYQLLTQQLSKLHKRPITPRNSVCWPLISGRKYVADPSVTRGQLFNAIIQGSSADLFKLSIYGYWKYLKCKNKIPSLKLLMQIHDELVLEVKEEEAEDAIICMKYLLEYPWFNVSVPILSSAKIGKSWLDKSDDRVPEFGNFYYKTKDGIEHVVTHKTWDQYYKAYNIDKTVVTKSCVGILSPEHIKRAQEIIGPISESFDVGGKRYIIANSQEYTNKINNMERN